MARVKVVVLTGGTSAEREICLKSGAKVMGALDPAKYEAICVDLAEVAGARAADLAEILFASGATARALHGGTDSQPVASRARPEVVFVALHGGAGENGTVQGMLELLAIPYTGSGVLASALAMNKIVSKRLFEQAGIPTPKWVALRRGEVGASEAILGAVGLPCVVKPACQGSTIGVTIVRSPEELPAALESAFQYGPEALAEQCIAGTEITGSVLGNDDPQVLPLIEIVPAGGFYDYQAKYTPGATQEIIPARVPEWQAERARELTLRAHHTLGCRGMSRVDMMAGTDEVWVLEVNTIPGLTDTSLVPRAAEAVGIGFPALVERLIELALEGR